MSHKKDTTININIEEFRNLLRNLSTCLEIPIKELRGHQKVWYEQLVSYVGKIYDSNAYPILFSEIQKHCSSNSGIIPGTVGAFLSGCLLQTNFTDTPSCSLLCSSALPPPSNVWNSCNHFVIRVMRDGEGY